MTDTSRQTAGEQHEFVYLILAHNKHGQLLRLIRTIRAGSPSSAILLHLDAKASLPDRAVLDGLGVRLVEPRFSVQWGDSSQVDALLESFAYALQNFDFNWLSIISGQDYPVRPLSIAEAELRNSPYDAFVKAAPAAPYRARYYSRFWTLPRFPYTHRFPDLVRASLSWIRRQLNQRQSLVRIEGGPRSTPLRFGIFWPTHPFGKELTCYKGSDWFTLSRRATTYLLVYGRNHPTVLAHYRRTFIPSESYFQTVLWNAKDLQVCDDHRRFILWNEAKHAHPVTLTMQHFDAMIGSGKDFGRKFDMDVDAEVLDALDQAVLGPQQVEFNQGVNNVFPAQA